MPRSLQITCLLIVCLPIVSSVFAYSQTEAPAVITFTLDFPSSEPEHYSLHISSDGSARYQSNGRVSSDSDEPGSQNNDSFDLDFKLDADTQRKVFALAAKAGYFQKGVASNHKGMAFTGQKTLGYKDARRNGESTYNYSEIPAVQELTSLLQSLSATLEFGHRLQYDRRYQKLALDEELKRMGEMVSSNQLIEVAAIRP